MKTPLTILIIVIFIANCLGINFTHADEFVLPKPGVMVHISPEYTPAMLKGVKVNPNNPFKFDFILDQGDTAVAGVDQQDLKNEANRLIKYFLASLTVPEKDLWVNLSPYEKDRIVPDSFGKTEMGRDLLAQDYLLKQITASLMYPEDEVGKKFWKRIYEESAKKFGTTNVPVNTFNKVWIVPEKAVIYENAKAGTAYVIESRLKVMLETDYLAQDKNNDQQDWQKQIIRDIIIPELTKEINTGKNFSQLRQVYQSLILATWYKKKIKQSILAQVYTNKNKVQGLSFANASINNPEQIYKQYLKAFKKGVFNYISTEGGSTFGGKEEKDQVTQQTTLRKYFSGGFTASSNGFSIGEVLKVTEKADAAMFSALKDMFVRVGVSLFQVTKDPLLIDFGRFYAGDVYDKQALMMISKWQPKTSIDSLVRILKESGVLTIDFYPDIDGVSIKNYGKRILRVYPRSDLNVPSIAVVWNEQAQQVERIAIQNYTREGEEASFIEVAPTMVGFNELSAVLNEALHKKPNLRSQPGVEFLLPFVENRDEFEKLIRGNRYLDFILNQILLQNIPNSDIALDRGVWMQHESKTRLAHVAEAVVDGKSLFSLGKIAFQEDNASLFHELSHRLFGVMLQSRKIDPSSLREIWVHLQRKHPKFKEWLIDVQGYHAESSTKELRMIIEEWIAYVGEYIFNYAQQNSIQESNFAIQTFWGDGITFEDVRFLRNKGFLPVDNAQLGLALQSDDEAMIIAPQQITYNGVVYSRVNSGSQGTVYRSSDRKTAIKVFNKIMGVATEHLQELVRVVSMLHEERPKQIINIYDVVNIESTVDKFPKQGVLMDWVEGDNLQTFDYFPAVDYLKHGADQMLNWIDLKSNNLADRRIFFSEEDHSRVINYSNFIVKRGELMSSVKDALINVDPIDMDKLMWSMRKRMVGDVSRLRIVDVDEEVLVGDATQLSSNGIQQDLAMNVRLSRNGKNVLIRDLEQAYDWRYKEREEFGQRGFSLVDEDDNLQAMIYGILDVGNDKKSGLSGIWLDERLRGRGITRALLNLYFSKYPRSRYTDRDMENVMLQDFLIREYGFNPDDGVLPTGGFRFLTKEKVSEDAKEYEVYFNSKDLETRFRSWEGSKAYRIIDKLPADDIRKGLYSPIYFSKSLSVKNRVKFNQAIAQLPVTIDEAMFSKNQAAQLTASGDIDIKGGFSSPVQRILLLDDFGWNQELREYLRDAINAMFEDPTLNQEPLVLGPAMYQTLYAGLSSKTPDKTIYAEMVREWKDSMPAYKAAGLVLNYFVLPGYASSMTFDELPPNIQRLALAYRRSNGDFKFPLELGNSYAEIIRYQKKLQVMLSLNYDGAWHEVDLKVNTPTDKEGLLRVQGQLIRLISIFTEQLNAATNRADFSKRLSEKIMAQQTKFGDTWLERILVRMHDDSTNYEEDKRVLKELGLLDLAMNVNRGSDLGGIDLTSDQMFQVKTDENGEINFTMDPAMLQQLENAQGFVPVIVNITPLKDLPQFLGIT